MSTRSDIYARPDLYDMDYEGTSNHDARFFARLLGRVRPRRVLEMACGSGRVTFTLAAALPTAEIVGVDSSIEILARTASVHDAAESSVRERVSFVHGDMRDWPGAGWAFDADALVNVGFLRRRPRVNSGCAECDRGQRAVTNGPPRFSRDEAMAANWARTKAYRATLGK